MEKKIFFLLFSPLGGGGGSRLILRDVLKRQVPSLSLFTTPPSLPSQSQKKTENYFLKCINNLCLIQKG